MGGAASRRTTRRGCDGVSWGPSRWRPRTGCAPTDLLNACRDSAGRPLWWTPVEEADCCRRCSTDIAGAAGQHRPRHSNEMRSGNCARGAIIGYRALGACRGDCLSPVAGVHRGGVDERFDTRALSLPSTAACWGRDCSGEPGAPRLVDAGLRVLRAPMTVGPAGGAVRFGGYRWHDRRR